MTQSWGVTRRKRSYIEIWILLLLIFSDNFFELLPITERIGPNGPFAFYLLSLFLVFTFYRRAWIRDSLDWLTPFWWIYVGVFLSFIPSLLYYDQSFVQSFFTNRRMFELVAYPILIALRPSERELRSALYAFSIIFLFVSFFVTYVAPGWIAVRDDGTLMDEGDFFVKIPGIRHVSLAFIFSVQRVMKDNRSKSIRWALFLFLILFLAKNRTSLLAAIGIILFIIYSMKMNARKLIIIVVIILSLLLMYLYTAGQWGAMYQETMDQITNPDYNRNKAFAYMFSRRNLLRYLLGDGFISANVNPIIYNLQTEGIFHSDVGFVGMWHQYGLIPVITILVITCKAFFDRQKSFLVRASAIYILIGSVTLSYFAIGETLLWLSIFLYMYYSDGDPSFNDNPGTRARVGWAGRRYIVS